METLKSWYEALSRFSFWSVDKNKKRENITRFKIV